jgi:hypothetical protein
VFDGLGTGTLVMVCAGFLTKAVYDSMFNRL